MNKSLKLAMLVVFVIVDVVLVAGAVRHVNSTPPSSDLPQVASTVTPSASAGTPSPQASTSAAPTQLEYNFSASASVAIASANDGTIVFGTRGRCAAGDDAVVQVSTNGGEDFSEFETGLTTTLAIRATGADAITIVGTGADCEPQQVTSTDQGRTWDEDNEIDLWYPSVDKVVEVVSPEGVTQPGDCIVTSVSQVTESSARVSCADGTFRGTGDNGAKWVTLGRLDNVRVADFISPTKGYALARYNGCGANKFETNDGGATWTPGGCITGDPAQAISATTNGLAAVVAGEPYVSADDGNTWSQP